LATCPNCKPIKKLEELQFEHPNADTISDTALLKQENLSGVLDEKVINGVKSDHSDVPIDHFLPNTNILFEQSQESSPAKDTCSNSKSESLSKVERVPVENTDTYVPADTKDVERDQWVHWAKVGTVVEIIHKRGEWATVRVPGQLRTEKVLIAELEQKP
jgi:hypothetical protein